MKFFSLSDNNYTKLICRQWPVIFMMFAYLDTHEINKKLTFKESTILERKPVLRGLEIIGETE